MVPAICHWETEKAAGTGILSQETCLLRSMGHESLAACGIPDKRPFCHAPGCGCGLFLKGRKSMTKNKKTIYGIALLVVLAAVLLGVWRLTKPKTQTGSKSITIEVKDDQEKTKAYDMKTDAEFLSQAMDELTKSSDFTYEASTSEYGLFINAVNGLTADYDKDGAYWAIYVNGEYGSYGADQQPVTDKDTYSFVYEKQ